MPAISCAFATESASGRADERMERQHTRQHSGVVRASNCAETREEVARRSARRKKEGRAGRRSIVDSQRQGRVDQMSSSRGGRTDVGLFRVLREGARAQVPMREKAEEGWADLSDSRV